MALLLLAAAAAAGLCLPCIKNIWTPGFVLLTAGVVALALFLYRRGIVIRL